MTTNVQQRADDIADSEALEEYGVYRPPRRSLAQIITRYWPVTLFPVLALAAVGVAVGRSKAPTYTASASINVGKSDISTQATPGYQVAAEALASSYSRLVASQHITSAAARKAHVTPAQAATSLSAVPIPSEPTFTISATGASPGQATRLARAAISVLQTYVRRTASQGGGPAQLLAKYQLAQALAYQLQHRYGQLRGRAANLSATNPPSQNQINALRVQAQVAALKAQSLSSQYLSLTQNGVAPTLDVLVSPTAATSNNRLGNTEKFGLIGALGGLVIGIAFAALVGHSVDRRRAKI
jgi:uncharacterized protein involved in exopolysaccharide biosynthesis